MKTFLLLGVAVGALLAGCGADDDSTRTGETCGAGTKNNGAGVCVPVGGDAGVSLTCGSGTKDDGTGECVPDGTVTCTDGTKLDTTTGNCVIDPAACQGGTVLVNNTCQDPTAALHVDVEEAAEPNGLGVDGREPSTSAAGAIALHAVGSAGVVVHGHLIGFQDRDEDGNADADRDTYTLTVTAPVLLRITAAGVGGVSAAFNLSSNDTLTVSAASYLRRGYDLVSSTETRELFIPAAGTYYLQVADTRVLYADGSGAGSGSSGQYYLTIDQLATPAPTPVTLADGSAALSTTISSHEVKFYSVAMGNGLNHVGVATDTQQAAPLITVFDNNALRYSHNGFPRDVALGGFGSADTTVVIVDDGYDYTGEEAPIVLHVDTASALELPAAGSSSQVEHGFVEGSTVVHAAAAADQWYLDTTSAGELLEFSALNWASTTGNGAVTAGIVDRDGNVVASFSLLYGGVFSAMYPWSTYSGLVRFPAAGRYYLVAQDPDYTPAASMTVTSSYALLAPVAATLDPVTPPTAAFDALGNAAFTYAPDGSGAFLQSVDVGFTDGSDGQLTLYDADHSYGQLGAYAMSPDSNVFSVSAQVLLGFDPIYTHDPDAKTLLSPSTRAPHILATVHRNDAATAATLTATTTPNVRALTVTPGTHTFTGTLVGSGSSQYLELAVPVGSVVTATFSSDDANCDVRAAATGAVGWIDVGEMVGSDDISVSDSEIATAAQSTFAYELVPSVGSDYSVTITVDEPPTYTVTAGTTAYADACDGGSVVSFVNSYTASETDLPAGFAFYGVGGGSSVLMFQNGSLSFDNTQAQGPYESMPSTDFPHSVIAPFWTNGSSDAIVCTKVIGTKLVVQWTGTEDELPLHQLQFQAILDGSDSSIELVYGPEQVGTGATATIGIQSFGGVLATQLGWLTTKTITPGTSKKLTP